MQFDRHNPETSKLLHFILDYYEKQGRSVQYLGKGQKGDGGTEGDIYYVDFFLDKKYSIRCALPLAIRTFPTISIGMGPYFISLTDLVPYEKWEKYIFGPHSKGLEYIFKKLDEYFKEQEQQQLYELREKLKELENADAPPEVKKVPK